MGRTHVTTEGFKLEVYSSLYMDWGLSISFAGKELFTSPCCLSNECYGSKPNPEKYEDWDEAERAELDGDDEAFVPWTDEDWQDSLKDEAETLIEAYLSDHIWTKLEWHKEAKEWAFMSPFMEDEQDILDDLYLQAENPHLDWTTATNTNTQKEG